MTEALTTPSEPQAQDSHGYPRPQLQRAAWTSLNGPWHFAVDNDGEIADPNHILWTDIIQVPFSPETPASGIEDTGLYSAVWYHRAFAAPPLKRDERLHLHFGAVDYCATVWVNGVPVARHDGGYTPFSADITDALEPSGMQDVIVRAEDNPADLAKPRGKQDWRLDPHSIWYPRTTGIWQTVWLEVVPVTHIRKVRWTSSLERWEIGMEAQIGGPCAAGLTLAVRLKVDGQTLAEDIYSALNGEVNRRIALSDPGIDDYRNGLLWSPSSPTLIDVELELRDASGRVLDSVRSYTALRAIAIQGDRFILNGRPLSLRLVLDQGYWPASGLSAPSDDALLRDVLLAKKLGFNGVRKHQKIEDPRFLYWADRMGLLVWEEMPSAYRYTQKSITRLTREWVDVIDRDISHPCIVAWVPFNESWGVPDLPESPAQRNYVQALYHLTKTLDPSRPVVGNDGWESVATDIVGIHDYDDNPERMGLRYGIEGLEARLVERERPGGRMLAVNGQTLVGQPIMLTEFGGIALPDTRSAAGTVQAGDPGNTVSQAKQAENLDTAAASLEADGAPVARLKRKAAKPESWGYSITRTSDDLLERYTDLLETVRALPAFAGFCYTQFTDTYQEANGLLYADRTPKAAMEELALATSGGRSDFDQRAQEAWQSLMMTLQPVPVVKV